LFEASWSDQTIIKAKRGGGERIGWPKKLVYGLGGEVK